MFGLVEISLGLGRAHFGLVWLATFIFWASQIKEIGGVQIVNNVETPSYRSPMKLGLGEISLGSVRTQFGLVGLAIFSSLACEIG